MDILSFVNSKDIREYLQLINYQCDSMQAAWLVYHSANQSYVLLGITIWGICRSYFAPKSTRRIIRHHL